MLLEGVEGRLPLKEVPNRVREFISGHYRQFSNYGPASLDAPAYRDSPTALLERSAVGERGSL